MIELKESKVYLEYLRHFKWLLLAGAVLGAIVGLSFANSQTPVYHQSMSLEVEYKLEDLTARVTLADQLVSLLRTAQIQKELEIDETSKVVIHKNGPLLINVKVQSANPQHLSKDLDQIGNYARNQFPVNEVGQRVEGSDRSSLILGAGFGLILGATLSLTLTLVKLYLRYY